jgi:NADPH:quinone reductase-like Zn-dependent oxidoreductase
LAPIKEETMRAIQVKNVEQGIALVEADIPQPDPGKDEILIRVHAVGVTPSELLWYPTIHTRDGAPRLHAVPGHEFSGAVAAVGANAGGFEVSQEVYGMSDWFADGATAEFCLAQSSSIAAKPASLTHEEAATVPIGALTAWQGLIERAKVLPGERVLVHGGSGAVGLFAIQLAHLRGAHVIATASSGNLDLVKQLGADEAIDYRAGRFEDQVGKVDVVFDTVGGEILDRSWRVLTHSGRMVAIAADSEGTTDQRVKDAFFIVEANRKQLAEIARMLDAGELKTFVNAAVPLEEAPRAYAGSLATRRGYGKVVVSVAG